MNYEGVSKHTISKPSRDRSRYRKRQGAHPSRFLRLGSALSLLNVVNVFACDPTHSGDLIT
jgi:hypothetical protein